MNTMIKQVEMSRTSKNWRGEEKTTVTTHMQIEGVITDTGQTDTAIAGYGRTPVLTIDAGGQTIQVLAYNGGLYAGMRPAQVGHRVRILTTEILDTDAPYSLGEIERI